MTLLHSDLETLNDIAPTIIVDASLGEYIEDFDLNTPAVTAYLRSRGLDDEQISNLTMHFVSAVEDESIAEGKATMGQYLDGKLMVCLLPPVAEPLSECLEIPDVRGNLHELMNKSVPKFVTHELEHYLQDLRDGGVAKGIHAHNTEFLGNRLKGILTKLAGNIALIGAETATALSVGESRPYLVPALAVTALAGSTLIMRELKDLRLNLYYESPYEIEAYAAADQYDHSGWFELTYRDMSAADA